MLGKECQVPSLVCWEFLSGTHFGPNYLSFILLEMSSASCSFWLYVASTSIK